MSAESVAPADAASPRVPERSAPAARRPTYTTSARARAEARTSSADRARPSAGAEPASATQTNAGPPASVSEDALLAPDLWFERIRERRARGETDAAIESLRRFRVRHPDVPVPADLRDLAE
ncbi:hypothetical protein ACFFGH_07065 [Lysobacter korlensis]|uniref:Uncharacterized protein n=1 Tax=Lysobacter korlensis TaxID=553636 RepID=A0ABV6RNW6_9GAMM